MGDRKYRRKKYEVLKELQDNISSDDEIEEIEITEDDIDPVVKRQRRDQAAGIEFKSNDSIIKQGIVKHTVVDTPASSQWLSKYEPTSVNDICLNPTKLKQVREELSKMVDGTSPYKLLVLVGPSGSSKSTTIKLLAKDLLGKRNADYVTEYIDSIDVEGTNQSHQFEEFLHDCRYKTGENLSVVLIEELPNIFHAATLIRFRQAINQWIHSDYTLPPLVLCLTEIEYTGNVDYSFSIENNLNVDTLLGKSITMLSQVKVIKFNSIANRYLTKTMNNIIQKERKLFTLIPKNELSQILDKLIKIGDVRSAIANLQMWAATYVSISKNLNGVDNDEKLIDVSKFLESSYNRETQINLFHAIGKVIYSSTNFLDTKSQDFLSIEQVLNDFQDGNFPILNLSLLENYTQYQNGNYSLRIASEIANDLSINDMVKGDANKEIGLRSTRSNLRRIEASKHKSYNLKIKFPRHFKMMKLYNKTNNQIRQYQRYINQYRNRFQDLNLIDGYFLPQIYNKKSRTRYRYNRLGGQFREIYADEDLPIEEDYNENLELDQFHIDIENKMTTEIEQDDEGDLSDPIEEDEGPEGSEEIDDDDDFLDDPELDLLISQGGI